MKIVKKILFGLFLFGLTAQVDAAQEGGKYVLVWQDEFDGTGAPDSTKWGYERGYIRNNELQYYTTSTKNARQNDGNLEITIRKEPMNGYDYTSASVTTQGRAEWLYGKIEGRFKMPKGAGLWSCFWTLGTSINDIGWPRCGEIDIFEHIDSENKVYATAHWADSTEKHTAKGLDTELDVEQWHVYSIEWTPQSIKWFVDDVQFHEIDITEGVNSTHEFHKPHYVLINFPIGGSWPVAPDQTTLLPATMYCDYVKVYSLAP